VKIGWVTPGGFDRSGTERVIPVFLGLTERLAGADEIHVFALRQGTQPDIFPLLGATVHELGGESAIVRGLPLVRRAVRALAAEHRNRPFDVLHGLWAGQSGLAAVLAARLLKIPVVVTVAGGELARLPNIRYGGFLTARERFVVKSTLRFASCVTAATEFALRPVRLTRPDAIRLPLGIDTGRYEHNGKFNGSNAWRLIQVAHLNRVKDQPTLLRAFQAVREQEPRARLEIVGEDTLRGEIQRMARDMGLDGSVSFPGVLPVDQVAERLATSHLMLHTSLHESGPMVFLEAAASNVATVGTAVGYLADLAPTCAVSVPIGDHQALARETITLLQDPDRRYEIARQARSFAVTHDADWTVARLRELYAGGRAAFSQMGTGAAPIAAPVREADVKS
jgi:glycosyltransferase involved in cell wall biosynthesis